MDSSERIFKRQGIQRVRLWFESRPHRLEEFRDLLARKDSHALAELLEEAAGKAHYPRRLLAQRRSLPANLWLERMEEILSAPAPSRGLREGLAPGLRFVMIRVSPQLWRSCQPRLEDLELLKEQGLRSVVNLRSESRISERWCGMLDLDYYHIPVQDDCPPTSSQVTEFLDLIPRAQPVLVHCLAGRGRTGTFVTCYRISQGMSLRDAIELTQREVGRLSDSQRRFLLERDGDGGRGVWSPSFEV